MSPEDRKWAWIYFISGCLALAFAALISSCAHKDTAVAPTQSAEEWLAPWSTELILDIDKHWIDLSKATDMVQYCSGYTAGDTFFKKQVFAEFMRQVSYQESAWNPNDEMVEKTMGKDRLTGEPVKSEGLFQLSYGDVEWMPSCKFVWAKRNIKDPLLNISCAVDIMADQVKRKGLVNVSSGTYWAVIRPGGSYETIDEIKASIKKNIKECQ